MIGTVHKIGYSIIHWFYFYVLIFKTIGKNSLHFHNMINSAFKLIGSICIDPKDPLAFICASPFLILLNL